MNFILKLKLLEAGILNHKLRRILAIHEMKKVIDLGCMKIKTQRLKDKDE